MLGTSTRRLRPIPENAGGIPGPESLEPARESAEPAPEEPGEPEPASEEPEPAPEERKKGPPYVDVAWLEKVDRSQDIKALREQPVAVPAGRVVKPRIVPEFERMRSAVWNGSADLIEADVYRINGLAFSPDGKHLATANFDGTVDLWSLAGLAER